MKNLFAVLLLLVGCGQLAAGPLVEVYKSPTCGCCSAWVDHLRENDFEVKVHETDNLHPIKSEAGVPVGKGSCHTAFVEGYAIEGHVPARDIRRLLEERPEAAGLTVPGMPAGSPGMEMGDRKDPFAVLLFRKSGETEVFSTYPGN